MDLSRYINGVKRLRQTLPSIANYYGMPKFVFWLDFIWSFILYGITPNQYIGFRFYSKSHFERREFYTFRQHDYFEKKLNDSAYYNVFWNKQEFNNAFSDFVHRDWMYCKDVTVDYVKQFLEKHKKVIVKPTSESSGHGIHVYNNDKIWRFCSLGG